MTFLDILTTLVHDFTLATSLLDYFTADWATLTATSRDQACAAWATDPQYVTGVVVNRFADTWGTIPATAVPGAFYGQVCS